MNFIHIRAMLRTKFLLMLFCSVYILLQGCSDIGNKRIELRESTPISATSASVTVDRGHISVQENQSFSFNLDEVNCQFQVGDKEQTGYWADELYPGTSTIDNLLDLIPELDSSEPEKTGLWRYVSGNVRLEFEDSVLYEKTDPRIELGEIVQHYGLPKEIVWQIPLKHYDGAVYATYLIYPEYKASFFVWDKIVTFAPDTEFKYSIITTQENFDGILATLSSNDFNQYIHSGWLCK